MRNRWPILVILVIWPIEGLLQGAAINALPGMPPVVDPNDIYSETHVGKLRPTVSELPRSDLCSQQRQQHRGCHRSAEFSDRESLQGQRQPQHVTPSYDLKTLWVLSDLGDSLTKIDPATGKQGETVRVKDPTTCTTRRMANMPLSSPSASIVWTFEIPSQWRWWIPSRSLAGASTTCDFSADGRYLIASCEFSGSLIKLDVAKRAVVGTLALAEHEDGGATLLRNPAHGALSVHEAGL
jgi:hypothetical protein